LSFAECRAWDYGEITPSEGYVWGRNVGLENGPASGDIIQFRDYQYERTVEQNTPLGSRVFETQLYFSNISTEKNGSRTTINRN